MKEKKTWWPKRKALSAIDKKIAEVSNKLSEATALTDIQRYQHQLDQLLGLREKLKKPKISKEVWIEVLKVAGMALALGAVIKYDRDGHVLPTRLEKWVPGPKL